VLGLEQWLEWFSGFSTHGLTVQRRQTIERLNSRFPSGGGGGASIDMPVDSPRSAPFGDLHTADRSVSASALCQPELQSTVGCSGRLTDQLFIPRR